MTTALDVTEDVRASHLQGSKVEEIARAIFGDKPIADSDLEFVFELVTEMAPSELTISAAETRQFKAYEPNQYYASMKIDLGNVHQRIFERVKRARPEDRAATFTECKRILYSLMKEQYSRNEDYLRSLISKQQIEDGLSPR